MKDSPERQTLRIVFVAALLHLEALTQEEFLEIR